MSQSSTPVTKEKILRRYFLILYALLGMAITYWLFLVIGGSIMYHAGWLLGLPMVGAGVAGIPLVGMQIRVLTMLRRLRYPTNGV
ncbi:MAG: hypothetical protein WC802_03515 [Patescibacteria group bacterium]|jgi:hypothetical protein